MRSMCAMTMPFHNRPSIKVILFTILFIFNAFAALAAEPSSDDIEDLLGIMESPTKRAAFTKNLKNLLEAKKALNAKKAGKKAGSEEENLAIRLIFDQFNKLSRDIQTEIITLKLMVEEMPEISSGVKRFFSDPENMPGLRLLLMDALTALLAMILFALFLRHPIRKTMGKMTDLLSKVGWGFVYILLKALPYAVLFIIFGIMFRTFPSFPEGRKLVFLLFTLLLLYQVIMAAFHVLLSPDASSHRLIPISDENANYLWIWMRRFAIYSFFYFLVTRALLWTHEPALYFTYLRGLLLLPFPLLITVFLFQVGREIHAAYEDPVRRKDASGLFAGNPEALNRWRRVITFGIHLWPILATAYIWVIFVTLIVNYDKGFDYLFRATIWSVSSAVVIVLAFYTLDLAFARFFRIKEATRRRFPGLEQKANRYLTILRRGLKVGILILGIGAIAQIWGIPISTFVSSDTGTTIILRAIAIIITVVVVASIIEINNTVSGFLLKEERRGKTVEVSQKQKTLIPVIQTAINIAAGFVGGIVVLERLGVNTTPILAGAGIVGLAVGFGSQTLVKDLISGLFILFEESIRVGDWAMVGNQSGSVESVGLRTVKLRDINGTLHVISNSSIDSLSNFSKVFSRTVMDIGVAYREDVDQVIAILEELGEKLQKDPEHGPNILEPLEIFGLDRFEDSAVIIRARFKTKPLKQWSTRRAFYRLMKKTFDERGIEIPFPHRTVYMGEPKAGKAPPLHVQMQPVSAETESGGS